MNIEERIVNIIKQATGLETIDINANMMDELEMASLEIFAMFSEIEEEFNVTIPTNEIENMVCIKDIIELVEKCVDK